MVFSLISDRQQNPYFSNWNEMMSNNQTAQGQGGALRKYEYQQRMRTKQNQSVVEQSLSYANKLSETRNKAEDELLQKKKLQYSFKKISSQIVRSKTAVSARKAVLSAKREVIRLKRLRGNEDYDEEELQLAIDHAKAMERVAKKKVHHLEQEEMIERHGKGISSCLEEVEEDNEENEEEALTEEELAEEEQQELEDAQYAASDYESDMSMEMLLENMEELQSDITETVSLDDMAELSEEMINEIADAMAEMLEEMDLTDLAETMYAPNPNMSEDDLKMLKIKHRTKEMKEIAKADKEYLKGLIEHEKNKAASAGSGSGSGTSNASSAISFGKSPSIAPIISIPGTSAPAPTLSGGFDISV